MGSDPTLLRDLLLFDPVNQTFLVHLEFNMNTKILNAYLVRKDFTDVSYEEDDDDTAYKYKPKAVPNLHDHERVLIKKVINTITYFLWSKAM